MSQWLTDNGSLMAAAVSYYMALSFFPLLLILIAGLGYCFRFTEWGRDSQARILEFVAEQTSYRVAEQVQLMLLDVEAQALLSGPIGIGALLFACILLFVNFEFAFDAIWKVPNPVGHGLWNAIKEALFYRLRAFLMLLCVGLLVVVTLLAGLAVRGVVAWTYPALETGWAWSLVHGVVAVALNTLALTLLYRFLPKADVRWREAAQGAVLAAIVWELGRQVLTALLTSGIYGVSGLVGSFIAILLWVFYMVSTIFLGAQYVQVIYRHRRLHPREPGHGPGAGTDLRSHQA